MSPWVIVGVESNKERTYAQFIKSVGYILGFSVEQMRGKNRRRDLVEARQLAFYVAHNNTGATLAKIGGELSKDHSTVLHGIRKINILREYDKEIINKIEKIKQSRPLWKI